MTVSIAAEISGMPSSISRVRRVPDVDLGGQDLGVGGHEQHVVEGQGFADHELAACRPRPLAQGCALI